VRAGRADRSGRAFATRRARAAPSTSGRFVSFNL